MTKYIMLFTLLFVLIACKDDDWVPPYLPGELVKHKLGKKEGIVRYCVDHRTTPYCYVDFAEGSAVWYISEIKDHYY